MNNEQTNEELNASLESMSEEISVQELESIAGGMLACNKPKGLLPCI